MKPGRQKCLPGEYEKASDRSVKKSTNGGFHMWKKHSLEHTDISTHSVINLSLSRPLSVSPASASHSSLVAKSYEADFLFKCRHVCHRRRWHHASLFSVMRWKRRLSVYIMFSKGCCVGWVRGFSASLSQTKPRHLADFGKKEAGYSSHLLAPSCS